MFRMIKLVYSCLQTCRFNYEIVRYEMACLGDHGVHV